jgi:hypothetical protein
MNLPSTLNLHDWLSCSSDRNILEIPALHLLNLGGGDECPRAQGGINSPALLHGLSSALNQDETTELRPDRCFVNSKKTMGRAKLGGRSRA